MGLADIDFRKDGATPKMSSLKKQKVEKPKMDMKSELDMSEANGDGAEKVEKKPKKKEKEDNSIGLDINEFCQI